MANTNTVTLTILAKNLASNVLNTVSKDLQGLSKTAQNVANDSFNKMGDAFNASATAITVGAGAIGGALALIGKSGLDSSARLEKMNIALETAMGGNVEATKQAQKTIIDFAKKTPYQLEEVMRGFVKLKNMGLEPGEKALTSYGDTASAMGKSLNDMVEAVADAATGEFERLKEFGIRASSQGDRVKFTFKGVTTEVGKNSKEIEDYLIKLGQTNFAGGMEKQSKSLLGIFSTLTDNISLKLGELTDKIGASGFVKNLAIQISNFVENINIDKLINNFENLYNILFKGDFSGGVFGFGEDSQAVDFLFKLRDVVNPIIENFKILNDQFKITDGLLFGLSGTIGILVFGGLATLVTSILTVTYPFIILAGILAGLYTAWQNQDSIIQTLIGWWNQFITILNNFIKFISETFKPELETLNVIWNTLVSVFNSLLPVLGFVIATIYILATQILSALFYAIEQLRQPMHDFIQAVFELAKPIMEILGPAFMVLVAIITGILIPTFQIVWAIVVQVFKGILETITGVIKIISGILNVFIGLIKGLFTGDFSQAAEGFKQIWEGLVSFFWGLIDIILAPIRGMIDGIINIFKGVDLAKIGIEMMNGLVNSLWAMKDKVMEPVWNTVNSIKNAFSNIKMPNIQMPKFANGGVVPKYATGGIIGGSSNTGDRVLARVNSGEMVLNKNQQAELFALANGGGMSKGSGQELKVEVNFNGTFLGSERDKFEFLTFIEDQLAIKIKQITQTV